MMNETQKRIWTGAIIGICLIAAGCFIIFAVGRPDRVDSGYREVMGTFARIVAVAGSTRQGKISVEAGFEQLNRIDSLMSDYDPLSQISRVNRDAFEKPVMVSPELFELLQKSKDVSRLTDGAFDITIGPLVDLWREAGEANSLPEEKTLALTRAKVGYDNLILDANNFTVRFAVDGMRLDLGGIAKGYAIDKAVEAMKQNGAIAGMVDVGGDIRCFGDAPGRKDGWLIGVQDPKAAKKDEQKAASDDTQYQNTSASLKDWIYGQRLIDLIVKDAAVATSGDYRRFVTINGKSYSHIIDTGTAEGAKKFSSVTVIANTALEADVLATAVSVLGREKGLALIESLEDVEAILITEPPEYEIIASSGAGGYVR